MQMQKFFSPDEGGGASSEEEQPAAIPNKVVVDGREIDVQAAIKDHINKNQWQAAQTQRDQQLASERQALTEFASKLVDKIGTPSAEKPAVQEVVDASIDELTADMPDPVEDKEAFAKWQARALRQVAATAKREAAQEAQTVAQRTSSAQNVVSDSNNLSNQVVNDNLRMVDEVVRRKYPEMTSQQKQDLIDEVGGLTAQRYAQPVHLPDGRIARRFNESAVDAAAKLLDFKPASTQVQPRDNAPDAPPPAPIAEPKPNAPLAQKIAYLRSLDARSVDLAFTRMSVKEKAEFGAALTRLPT